VAARVLIIDDDVRLYELLAKYLEANGVAATHAVDGRRGLAALEGAGVYYGAALYEAATYRGQDVIVVGGANSAGQAALNLAEYARQVTLVVRANALEKGMSHYLVRQIEATPNVEVRLGTEVVGGSTGEDGWLQSLELRAGDGAKETVPSEGLFLMIGAHPNTDWLPAEIAKGDGGFICTGDDAVSHGEWPLEQRSPLSLETSLPGVFAAGDVRHGSMSRVASAVGEGSIAIRLVHELFEAEQLQTRDLV